MSGSPSPREGDPQSMGVGRCLADLFSPAISSPTTNREAKSEQSAALLNFSENFCTLTTRLVASFEGIVLYLVSAFYMMAPEKVTSNWFGEMHNIPPSARDICNALTQTSGGITFICACLLVAGGAFISARHAPWLALGHWISTVCISKNLIDSAPSDLGVDRFVVAAVASLHFIPALIFSLLTIANAITKEDPMMIDRPWRSLQRSYRTGANIVFFILGCFYILWSVSWMIFPSYTVQRSIYDRLSMTALKYAANNEFAVAGPFFFLGLLHIVFSGLASMPRELTMFTAFGHAVNIGLYITWFSGGAMESASFRPSILYGAIILHLLLTVTHTALAHFVEPHPAFVQMAQEAANVVQQNLQQTMQSKENESLKEKIAGPGAGEWGGQPSISEQMSSVYQKAKESFIPSDIPSPSGSLSEKASHSQAKEGAQSLAQQAKEITQSYAEKVKEGGKTMMQPSTGHEEQYTPATMKPSPSTKSSDRPIERGAIETKTTQHAS